ncbi:hypothetical protein GOV10_04845 [Candidatus Woesearchaeota archaeon]|nr:hypothetical protein [Candidatus Woesearchaeota archaeon]
MRLPSILLLTGALLCAAQPASDICAGGSNGGYHKRTPPMAKQEINLLNEQYDIHMMVKSEDFFLPMPLKGTIGPEGIDIYLNFFLFGKKKILSGEITPGYHEIYIDIPLEAEDSFVKVQIEEDGTISSFEVCEAENVFRGKVPGACYIAGKGRLVPDLKIDFLYHDDSELGDLYRLSLETRSGKKNLFGGIKRFYNPGTIDERVEQSVRFKGRYEQKHK